MKTDFLLAITQLAAERNLPKDVVFGAVEAALVTAFKKDEVGARQDISVKIHPVSGDVKVYTTKTVVESPADSYQEMSLAEAKKFKKDAELGERLSLETTSFHAGRIAAQTAKQVVLQRLREAEREFIFGEFIDREGDIVSGVVQRIEPRQVVIDLGKTEGVLPMPEQVRSERYRVGQRLKLYLLEVNRTNRGPRLVLSRSHPNLVRRLFELEVPEIFEGNVELKAVAREPGYRSKVAVAAKQGGLDAVGSCVGLRGVRIQNVVNELNGERIDVIQWDAEPSVFIANALSPAQVVSVATHEAENTAVVVVPDGQLSLAIGKEGQNARLAARITGWRIDIKSASAAESAKAAEEAEKAAAVEEAAAVAGGEFYDMPLEQVGLSSRTFNLLLGNGITKVGEILDKSDGELLGLKGLGKKSLAEVRERLAALSALPVPAEVEEVEVPSGIGFEEPVEEVAAAPESIEGVKEVIGEEIEGAAEEEEELIPYEAPAELEVVAATPQIRFAEDIFGPKPGPIDGGKKGKKKKKRTARDEKSEAEKARRGRRGQEVPLGDDLDDMLGVD